MKTWLPNGVYPVVHAPPRPSLTKRRFRGWDPGAHQNLWVCLLGGGGYFKLSGVCLQFCVLYWKYIYVLNPNDLSVWIFAGLTMVWDSAQTCKKGTESSATYKISFNCQRISSSALLQWPLGLSHVIIEKAVSTLIFLISSTSGRPLSLNLSQKPFVLCCFIHPHAFHNQPAGL